MGWMLRTLFVLFLMFPIYTGVKMSLTPFGEVGNPSILPQFFHYHNYLEIFSVINLGRQLLNSLIYAFSVTLFNLMFSMPAAYALSRFRFIGRTPFLFGLLVTQMIAAVVIIPSLYTLIKILGVLNTYAAVILPLTAVTTALSIWLLKGFFDSIPIDLEEAAFIDGCTRLGVLGKIIIPLSGPGITTAAIFSFITAYNNFFLPLVLITNEQLKPVTVGLFDLYGELVPRYPLIMAGSFISSIPILIIYLFLQRYVIKGLTAGGVKR